ncbi:hypothetical protein Z043_104488 [Scleropages formosus]|uniref:Cadherin domain-containing protein n=1 Tax=Scleropages formosus TaxID=113540 RepID=A0A0P7VK55_SCLFO|nr:hypothetical protein Z043_104488 [Scleropages formosus]
MSTLTLKNLNYSVPEEQGPGTVIGNIAKDARIGPGERGKKSNFRVLENSAPHLIDVDPESGLLYTKQRIDRETMCRKNPKCQLSMEVFANDKEICMIKVEVQDINDNSPSFPSEQIDIDIAENAAPGTRFPLTSAHDPDSGENGLKSYQITRDDYNLFSLDVKSRGDGTKFPELVIQRPLDREERSHHTLILTAIDGGEYPRSGTMQINVKVIDSNDNSPMFEQPSYVVEIPENSPPGKLLIDLNATDPDEGSNGQIVYSFSGYAPDRIRELFSIDPRTGVIKIQGEIDYEENPVIEIDVQAKDLGPNPIPGHCKVTVKVIDRNDNWPSIGFVSVRQGAISEASPPGTVIALDSGSPHQESNATVRVSVLDVNDNAPVIVLPLLQNDTAEIHVPRNVGVGHIVTTVRAVDNDYGESGRLTYEISDGNEENLFEMDPITGEVLTVHPLWEEVAPVVELIVKVVDHGKPTLSAVAKLIIKAYNGPVPEGEPRINEEQHSWDMSLPLIVTLSIVSIMLLAAMITIAVKCKREKKEIRTYNCRIAEYSHPQLGKGKKKKINKNDIMLVQSEVEERDAMNVMNVVSSPSLATSPMYFDYQTRLPLSSPRSEVMYLKPTSNSLTVPQGHVGCHTSFTGTVTNTTETPSNRMSIIQLSLAKRSIDLHEGKLTDRIFVSLNSDESTDSELFAAAQPYALCCQVKVRHALGQAASGGEAQILWTFFFQTDNFPAEPNYMGSRQQFVQSSTFKDPERASLRDSGHGDSDQADSDQDTNKGSCCDMSAKEALRMKATSVKPQPLEQAGMRSSRSAPPFSHILEAGPLNGFGWPCSPNDVSFLVPISRLTPADTPLSGFDAGN